MAETTAEPTQEVSDLDGFLEWAKQFDDGQFLFRGVMKESYDIEASAYRRLPDNEERNADKLLKINQELITKARLLGHDLKDGRRLSDLELLADLQHFGAATCLIDFTRSALAALWFACQERSNEGGNGKVFSVPALFEQITPELIMNEKIDLFFEKDTGGKYPLYQWQPKLQNNRIVAQQSVFVFGGGDIEASECVILESGKPAILKALEMYAGINEASIFPDFEGFARLHAQDRVYFDPDVLDNMRRGDRAFDDGKMDEAIEFYSKAIDHYKTSPPTRADDKDRLSKAYNNRGLAFRDVGNEDLFTEDLRKSTELKPDEETTDE